MKKLFIVFFIVLAVFIACIGFLPLLAEKILLPQFLPAEVSAEYEISIYRLGLHGCTFHISGRPGRNSLVAAGNIRIEWTPAGLREGRFDRLTMDGLRLNIPVPGSGDDTGVSISTGNQSDSEPFRDNRASSLPPLVIDTIKVVNSTVSMHSQQGVSIFPLSLSAQRVADASATEKGMVEYSLDVYFASQKITADVEYLHREKEISATAATVGDLHDLAGYLRDFVTVPTSLSGKADLRLAVSARIAPFSVSQMEGDIKFQDMLFEESKLLVRSDRDTPAVISFSGTPDQITLEADDFVLVRPLASSIHLDAVVSSPEREVNWQANLRAQPAAGQSLGGGYILAEAPVLGFALNGEYQENTLQLQVRSADPPDAGKAQFLVRNGDNKLQVGGIVIDADVYSVPEKGEGVLQGRFAVRGEDVAAGFSTGQIRLPRIQFDGKGILNALDMRGGSSVIAELQLGGASLNMDEREFRLQGIDLEFPLVWPADNEKQNPGIFQIAEIVLRDVRLGKVKAELVPQPDKIELRGSIASGMIPAGKIDLHGSLFIPEFKSAIAELNFSIAETPVAPENFTDLFPALGKISGSGRLRMKGQGAVYPHRVSGSLSLEIDEGNLEIPAIQTRMEGIHLAADFPALPSLYSSPSRNVSIRSLKSKQIELTDVQSSFRIESPQSLFMEKISANWSGGRVFTSSFRLHKEKPDIEIALICDRLNLAEVLTQLGLAQAEGQGAVSGRIPLLYNRGNIYVDHGFLFSTPGEKGTLKIIESEQLIEGIPQDVPHFSPLMFAGAALKNFQYDWAKLLISSEEENLLLQLKIDGKPAEKLPYRFDPKENVFRKLAKGESGGIDQPIKLDVNFNVPLNELMRYNKELQSLFQNTRE